MSGEEPKHSGLENKRREIKFKLGPVEVSLRGYDILLTLLLCGLVALGTTVYFSAETVAKEHRLISENQERQQEQLAEMVYVLTLSPERREALGLEMPKSLRTRLRAQ